MPDLPRRVQEAEERREFLNLLDASSFGPLPERQSPLPDGIDEGEWCLTHRRYEKDRPGDYRTCGECCHIWRTQKAFVRDVLAARASDASRDVGDPLSQETCPLCGNDL